MFESTTMTPFDSETTRRRMAELYHLRDQLSCDSADAIAECEDEIEHCRAHLEFLTEYADVLS
jgi:hypothetical protein